MMRKAGIAMLWTALLVPVAVSLYRAGAEGTRTFLWDPSSHSLNGLRMADGITRLDPIGFLKELYDPHHYPPGHSILQTPFFLAMGRTRDAARATSIAAFLALAALAIALARRCGGDAIAGPIVLVAAFASSPHLLTLAAVPMLEIFAALGLVFFSVMYLRSLEAPDDRRKALWAGIAATMVYLTSTNFAVILFAAIVAYEALRGDLRAAWRGVRTWFAGYKPVNVWNGLAVAALAVTLFVLATGGIQRRGFSMTSPLGPLSAAIVVLGLQLAWEIGKRRKAMTEWPVRLRGFFWGAAVPLVVWLLSYPPRIRGTLDFMGGAGSSGDFAYRMTYYPKYWIPELHLSPAIGIFAAAAFVAMLVTWKRQKEPVRFVAVLAAMGTLALFAHGMRDLRFFVGLLPLYWVLLAAGLARVPGRLVVAGLLAATCWPAWRFHREDLAPRIAKTFYSEPGFSEVLTHIGDEGAARGSVRVLGTFEGLSHHIVEFEMRKRRSLRDFRYESDLENPAKKKKTPREVFDRWLSKTPEARVITIECAPGREPELPDWVYVRDYATYLETCPRYRLVSDRRFEIRGLRIRVWEAVP